MGGSIIDTEAVQLDVEGWCERFGRRAGDIERYLEIAAKSSKIIRLALLTALLAEISCGIRANDNPMLNPIYWAKKSDGSIDPALLEEATIDIEKVTGFADTIKTEYFLGSNADSSKNLYPQGQTPGCKDFATTARKYGIAYVFFASLGWLVTTGQAALHLRKAWKYANQPKQEMPWYKKGITLFACPFMTFETHRDGTIQFKQWDMNSLLLTEGLALLDYLVFKQTLGLSAVRDKYFSFLQDKFNYFMREKKYGEGKAMLAARKEAGSSNILASLTSFLPMILATDNLLATEVFLGLNCSFYLLTWALEKYRQRRTRIAAEDGEEGTLINYSFNVHNPLHL